MSPLKGDAFSFPGSMSGFRAQVVVLLLFHSLVSRVEALGVFDELVLDGGSYLLDCGLQSLRFVLLSGHKAKGSSVITSKDADGMVHSLKNDSSCGTWVSHKPDGSLVVGAAYTGCFTSEKDGEYTITLGIEEVIDGQKIYQEKKLKCPVLHAMDAPSADVCDSVHKADRLPCGSLPITQAGCQANSCCYDPSSSSTPCYFGSQVTAQCTHTGHAIVAVSKYLTVPSLDLGSVHLSVATTCSGFSKNNNDVFLVYQFPLACGSIYQDGDATVYENRLEATNDVRTSSDGSITRASTFRLTVRCSFSASSGLVPLTIEVFTVPPPLPVSSSGSLLLEMRIATDQAYNSYYKDSEYPVIKVLKDPVFVEVRVLQRTDPNLVLVLNECWATSSSDPMQPLQWPILENRCPYSGDNYKTQVIPVVGASSILQFPAHYKRFVVTTFTFVNNNQPSLRGQIYFHCSASVCFPSFLETCLTTCPPFLRKRRMTEALDMEHKTLVTSEGPVYFNVDDDKASVVLGDSNIAPQSMLPKLRRGALVGMGLLCVAVSIGLWKYRRHLHSKVEATNV
ncbi:zona pellucida sperm-binding protein 4-like [Pleurodeles waltl]|uniref:zona pellucida sperm-binding protein 4-like n=1 Tax=Pleurodeles waltl TaxID=8319 RepID=UPI0037094BBE